MFFKPLLDATDCLPPRPFTAYLPAYVFIHTTNEGLNLLNWSNSAMKVKLFIDDFEMNGGDDRFMESYIYIYIAKIIIRIYNFFFFFLQISKRNIINIYKS